MIYLTPNLHYVDCIKEIIFTKSFIIKSKLENYQGRNAPPTLLLHAISQKYFTFKKKTIEDGE